MQMQLLFLFFITQLERSRTARRTTNSLNDSLALLESVLAPEPQLNSSDTPLRRLLRGLQRATELPNGVHVKELELELLATLGIKTAHKWFKANESEPSSADSEELQVAVFDIRAIVELSHRYWALHDSQDQVLQQGRKAARTDIAMAGGEARRDSLAPLKKQVETLAFEGLRKSGSKNFLYGEWEKQEDIWYGIHGQLSKSEQQKVQPSTIAAWVKAKYPELVSGRRRGP